MRRLVAALGLLAGLLAAACSSGWSGDDPRPGTGPGEASPAAEASRAAEADGIEVQATWLTAGDSRQEELQAYPAESFVHIEISFTTHSGDLNSIEMKEAASLRQAGSLLAPESWVSTSDDSHHRAGILVFPRQLQEGAVELVLDIGEEELSMRWDSVPGASGT